MISEVSGSHGSKKLVLSVYDFDENHAPILRYEKSQMIDDRNSGSDYVQSIEARKNGFQFCEDWQIASWMVHECHEINMNQTWEPFVLSHEIQTSEPKAHSSQSNYFNFGTLQASRDYDRIPDGPFMPPLHRKAEYSMIFASQDMSLPALPVLLQPTQSSSYLNENEHAPIMYDIRWNDSGVYLSFELTDMDILDQESCSDQMSVQQADHLELWFDLSPALAIRSDQPQSWMLEYEKNYRNEPYRHSLDADVYGLAVTPDGCVIPMAPTRDHWPVVPQVSTEIRAAGYRVHVFVPASFYGKKAMSEMDRAQGLGFSARQHDIHTTGSYESVATSSWQWPDPFTFGQIWLMPASGTLPPPFPLQWNSWLVDN